MEQEEKEAADQQGIETEEQLGKSFRQNAGKGMAADDKEYKDSHRVGDGTEKKDSLYPVFHNSGGGYWPSWDAVM